MQQPNYNKRNKIKKKICKECGAEFMGHPIAKYCEAHRDISNRAKKEKIVILPGDINLIYEHDFIDPTEQVFDCCLEGCPKRYTITLLPKQNIYPKYCLEHRNEFKRSTFLRLYKQPT